MKKMADAKESTDKSNLNDEEVELMASVNEEDILGLDVVDAWEEDEKDAPRRRSWDRSRGSERKPSSREREKEKEHHERDRDRDRGRRRSRSTDRRDYNRRDPIRSSKDIEQDKLRSKKDNNDKILAEKEKAIKTLLDSDTVVPPGTEGEAIQILSTNKKDEDETNKQKKTADGRKRSRTPVRNRLGARRSPRRSPRRFSPGRRRSPSSDRRRRRSPIRRSNEKENSTERRLESRRRLLIRDKSDKLRRSRSFDRRDRRSRSHSLERRRRSRSPFDRRRDRRRSPSRSPDRRSSPKRTRKRSPFINELARQFSDGARPETRPPGQPPLGPMQNPMGPGGPPFISPGPPNIIPGPPGQFGMMPGGPPGMIPTAGGMIPNPGMPMDIIPGPMDIMPGSVILPGGMISSQGPVPGPFIGFDGIPQGPSGAPFDPLNRGPPPPDYTSAPVMYPQGNLIPPMNSVPHNMRAPSPIPQPVPAPGQSVMYPMQSQSGFDSHAPYRRAKSPSPVYRAARKEERMKTPEPPIISDFKQKEKASLSSLLEASVSSKDVSGVSSFKGHKAEIIRQCERALRSLPAEDPRLKMKGRFFFDPTKKETSNKEDKESASNSILIRKGRSEIFWDEEENQLSASNHPQKLRKRVTTHQKQCQTESPTKQDCGVQIEIAMTDFCMQVESKDLDPPVEEKPKQNFDVDTRPGFDDRRGFDVNVRRGFDDMRATSSDKRGFDSSIRVNFDERRGFEDNRGFDDRRNFDERRAQNDRLDWSMRETFDHSSQVQESDDLRWSLQNSSMRDKSLNQHQWGKSNNNFPNKAAENFLGLMAASGVVSNSLQMGPQMEGSGSVLDNFLAMEARRNNFGSRDVDNRVSRNVDVRGGDIDNRGFRNMDIRGSDMDNRGIRNMDIRGGDIDNRGLRNMDVRGGDIDNRGLRNMDIRGGDIDSRGLRNMDVRGGDIDNRGPRNMDGRAGDIDNRGPRNMEGRGGDIDNRGPRNVDNNRGGDLNNFGSRNMDTRGGDLNNYGSRNMDNRGGDMNNFGRGGMDMYGDRGNMDRMVDARERLMNKGNKDLREMDNSGGRGNYNRNNMGIDRKESPKRQMEDGDDLEIIEERVSDQAWKNSKGMGGPPVSNKQKNPMNKQRFRNRLGPPKF